MGTGRKNTLTLCHLVVKLLTLYIAECFCVDRRGGAEEERGPDHHIQRSSPPLAGTRWT